MWCSIFDMRIRREMIAAHREWHSNITMNEIMSTLKDFLEKISFRSNYYASSKCK